MEWHIVPAGDVVPFDVSYVDRFYPTAPGSGGAADPSLTPLFFGIRRGHAPPPRQFICVGTTQKPTYLPGSKQFYGTLDWFENSVGPLCRYLGPVGFFNG